MVLDIAAPAAVALTAPVPPVPFDQFVRVQLPGLVRYATLLTGSQPAAEDIVQDVLGRLYPRWERLCRDDRNVLAYVRKCVTNEHVSWRRRWHTRNVVLFDNGVALDTAAPVDSDRDDELWRRVQQLPHRQRTAIVLRYYADLDDSEIAEVMQCRIGSAHSYISRGLATLRQSQPNRGDST